MDNLRQIAIAMKSEQTVDEKYIRQRIAALKAATPSKAQAQELASLEQQLKLRQENLGRIAACLAQNEQALAQLDSALAAIAQMKTGSTQASVDMETAMNDLQQIARRARDYSSQQS